VVQGSKQRQQGKKLLHSRVGRVNLRHKVEQGSDVGLGAMHGRWRGEAETE
jgi:hypothetical protein